MIQKYYEVICDYCLAAIWHSTGSKEITLQQVRDEYGFIVGKHHFCDEECYQNWLDNNKQNFLQGGN